jgi:activating signal cointegrator complex subunit 1
MYSELVKPAKLPLLQSIVSTILVHMIFDAYFVGLSKDQEEQFKRTEESLAALSKFYRTIKLHGCSLANR